MLDSCPSTTRISPAVSPPSIQELNPARCLRGLLGESLLLKEVPCLSVYSVVITDSNHRIHGKNRKNKTATDRPFLFRLCQLPQKSKTEYSSVVPVGEMKVERVATDDRGVFERNVCRYLAVVQHLLARPFVDASGARARTP